MSARQAVVFLFDVDNTLLDNDAVLRDYRAHLVREAGREAADHYWAIFEELRRDLGYVDYLGALQRYRLEHLHEPRLFHYALDPGVLAGSPPADLAIAGIGDLLAYDLPALLGAATGAAAPSRRDA